MADDDMNSGESVSFKESEGQQLQEKDQDTVSTEKFSSDVRQSTPRRSLTPSKSNAISGKKRDSLKAPGSLGHFKSSKESKSRLNKDDSNVGMAAQESKCEQKDNGLLADCVPLFFTSQSQEIFHCQCDVDVTQENPIKIITKLEILDDMKMRAAVCDFHPFKQQILDYPGDEILIVYDYDFKYGQNFYIALTEEAKENILNLQPTEDFQDEKTGEDEKEEDEGIFYEYVPPESKAWISQGSEKEIADENMVKRVKLSVSVERQRRNFGAPCQFSDCNAGDQKQKNVVECTAYQDQSSSIKKMEQNTGTQAVANQVNYSTQTDWRYPRNANTQYYARDFSSHEVEELLKSNLLSDCMSQVEDRFHLSLQQNAIMDVFYDDWSTLGDHDDPFGSKADNHLKEYQSFTDLHFSKDKSITCIQWHPSVRGVIAVSVAERLTFDERIDQAAKVIMTPSLILIWSFTDPICPRSQFPTSCGLTSIATRVDSTASHIQLILEAPEDIYSFSFCPTDGNIIAGGCYNGQIIMWDISAHSECLKAPKGSNRNKRVTVIPGFEDQNALQTPIVRYCAVSGIEFGHKASITDLQWMPDHFTINRLGVPLENQSGQCVQILTCATDNCVLFWDIRPPKNLLVPEDRGLKNPMGVPNTFHYLDLTWKPILKMYLNKSEPGGDHAPIKISMQERQGDKNAVFKAQAIQEKDLTQSLGGTFTAAVAKPGSGKERTLQDVQTHLYIGTEDGEIVYGGWMPQKDQDTGKLLTPKPDYYHAIHDGPVTFLQRSPFLKEVLLSLGGWTWAIWKEGVSSGPILHAAASLVRLSAAYWSPTRPSVFYIAKVDGSLDVWDLLDKTHEPAVVQSVSPSPITAIYPYQVTKKQQLIAVGDNSGTLHILEVPWSLRQSSPGELNSFTNYIEREVKRRAFVVTRWDIREQEKQGMAAEAKRRAGIAPNVVLTDEEIEMKMKFEYQQYLKDEYTFLRELGLLKDEEEELPEV